MSKSQSGRRTVFFREFRELCDDCHYFFADKLESFSVYDYIRVVGNVATRRSEVYYRRRIGANKTVSVNVSHYVVADELFTFRFYGKIDVVEMCREFRNLLVGNIQAARLLAFGECEPQPAEKPYPVLLREKRGHFARRISRDQRVIINVVIHINVSSGVSFTLVKRIKQARNVLP